MVKIAVLFILSLLTGVLTFFDTGIEILNKASFVLFIIFFLALILSCIKKITVKREKPPFM